MPGKVTAGLQGGYHGLAELLHGPAAQPGVAVVCGVQLEHLLPPWGPGQEASLQGFWLPGAGDGFS